MLHFSYEHEWFSDPAYRPQQLQFNNMQKLFLPLFLWHFTTVAVMFQLCLCYQKWECYGEKCLQTLTFPLLHHVALLWKMLHYQLLTGHIEDSSSTQKSCGPHCFKLSVLLAQEDPGPEVARMTWSEIISLYSCPFFILFAWASAGLCQRHVNGLDDLTQSAHDCVAPEVKTLW